MANATSPPPPPPPLPPLDGTTEKVEQKAKAWHKFGSWTRWIVREEQQPCAEQKQEQQSTKPGFGRRLSRKVVPGLPRPGTFRRQNSERREKLKPVEQTVGEKRTVSVDRRRALSARPASPPCNDVPKRSAPEVRDTEDGFSTVTRRETWPEGAFHGLLSNEDHQREPPQPPPPPPPPPPLNGHDPGLEKTAPSEISHGKEIDEEIRDELERKWILNLSMHFRDHSPREKFFLTYAETPQKWRRVTVSCDYRNAPWESLERDLQSLQFQRDKSARIYESIRSSLSDIQFYQTVTNLKLETRDDRLHVHVTEDTHEIIPYPTVHAVQHLDCRRYTESQIHFESHMSGFVYKVKVEGNIWIKKEIPGPDSVDEFLYEINALNELQGSKSVIQFQGLVVDESCSIVKGLLIGFAEQGALVDILYDYKGRLPWSRRERWARQIIRGLSEIHEAGFVQGDFTLSNIVIDELDNAMIIDINRRGCPVGWEPPEISKLVESSQRISMYIGVKSDLFQLGMVLWALAEEVDEPERQERPLSLEQAGNDIPSTYRELVHKCLSPKPRDRFSAKDLLSCFPKLDEENERSRSHLRDTREPSPDRHAEFPLSNQDFFVYDKDSFRQHQFFNGDYTYDSRPGSIDLPFDGPGSYIVSRRGRPPAANISHLSISDHSREASPGYTGNTEPQIVAVSPTHERKWEEIEMDGTPYLIQRNSLQLEEFKPGSGAVDPHLRREFAHVDSGLADMDLAGVGGHATLMVDKGDVGDRTPRIGDLDLKLDGFDDNNTTGLQL